MKEDGTPFRIVLESNAETAKVISTPRTITPVSRTVDATDANVPVLPPIKNIVMIAISVGNATPGKQKLFAL